MNRRGFLGGVLSTGLAGALLPGAAARAQAGEIRIGMSAAFRGAAAGLGSELHRGAQAYYGEINARGGLFGRQITVVALDDGYNPDPCIRNTIQLLDREKVFLLSNYVGTPTLTRALPVIKQYADQAVVLVGNFTGAQPQREAPYVDQVFNVRASYRQEMTALVERFWQAGARRFGVYYQIDAYGRSGTDGVARALAARNTKIVAEATYVRNAKFEEDMTIAVRALREGGSEVVLCTGAYQGCAAFVRSARDAGWTAPISNASRTSTPRFGITRSTSAPGKAAPSRETAGTAARIETTLRAAPSSGATRSSAAGFTATTTKSARSAISRLERASPPSSAASSTARPDPESENSMPLSSPAQPRAMAAAMLPDPTKPTIIGSSLATQTKAGPVARPSSSRLLPQISRRGSGTGRCGRWCRAPRARPGRRPRRGRRRRCAAGSAAPRPGRSARS